MSYDLLPEGEYSACVIPFGTESASIQFGETPKKGTPYAGVRLGILDGEQSGKSIFCNRYLTEKTIVRTVNDLHKLGFKGNRLNEFVNQNPSTTVSITVEHEEHEGKVSARVKWINSAAIKLAPSDLDALSDKLEEELKKANDTISDAPEEPAENFGGDNLAF